VSTATGRTDWALAEASAPATSVSAVLLATMATANWLAGGARWLHGGMA